MRRMMGGPGGRGDQPFPGPGGQNSRLWVQAAEKGSS